MKKTAFLAFACALFMGQGLTAQTTLKEITYVEDPSQGVLFNRFQDNWYITAEGGVSNTFTKGVARRYWGDRFAPAASLYVGKNFSPIIGLRGGFSWFQNKGIANSGNFLLQDDNKVRGMYKTKNNALGAAADVTINLLNWWGGYKPDRFYNLSVYGGVGGYFTTGKEYDRRGNSDGWKNAHYYFFTPRVGIINSFNLSKNFALALDLRVIGADKSMTQSSPRACGGLQAFLSATYNFNKTAWSAPIVAVVPEIEDCEPLRARLQAADARIEDLEAQLKACLNRPVEKVVETVKEAPLATIYFPIGVSRLNRVDNKVLGAVAEQIKASGKSYTITGWADTYTGTDAINARLRTNRAKSVEKALIANGVPAAKLSTKSGVGNLNDLGIKYVALDRCATIDENK